MPRWADTEPDWDDDPELDEDDDTARKTTTKRSRRSPVPTAGARSTRTRSGVPTASAIHLPRGRPCAETVVAGPRSRGVPVRRLSLDRALVSSLRIQRRSGEQGVDLAALDEVIRPLELVVDDRVGRDAEEVIDGRDQVRGIVRVAGRIGGDCVGGAEALPCRRSRRRPGPASRPRASDRGRRHC